jgi:hypothetical protein
MGYQWVMPRFTWQTIAREWSELFEEYLSLKKGDLPQRAQREVNDKSRK